MAGMTDLEVIGSQLEGAHVGHIGVARRQAARKTRCQLR